MYELVCLCILILCKGVLVCNVIIIIHYEVEFNVILRPRSYILMATVNALHHLLYTCICKQRISP